MERGTVRTLLRPAIAAALVVVAAFALAACSSGGGSGSGSGGGSGTGGSGSSAPHGTIIIKNFGFTGPGVVKPGSTVHVHNEDSVDHTVTADSGNAFDVQVPAGGSATFTAPSKPGTYPYHCTIHTEMHGTLKVR